MAGCNAFQKWNVERRHPRYHFASIMILYFTTSPCMSAVWSPFINERLKTISLGFFMTDSMQRTNDSSKMDSKVSRPSFDILASMRTGYSSKGLISSGSSPGPKTLAIRRCITRFQVSPYGLSCLIDGLPVFGLADVITTVWALTWHPYIRVMYSCCPPNIGWSLQPELWQSESSIYTQSPILPVSLNVGPFGCLSVMSAIPDILKTWRSLCNIAHWRLQVCI